MMREMEVGQRFRHHLGAVEDQMRNRPALTQSLTPAMFFSVIHAGFQTRMAMMRTLLAGAVVSLTVRV